MSYILTDNGNLINPVLIPGATDRRNQDGSIDATATFAIRKTTPMVFLAPGGAHPLDGAAYISDSECEWLEAYALLKGWYKGVWDSTVQKVEGIASAQLMPIELNQNFMGTLAGTAVAPLNNAIFLLLNPSAGGTPSATNSYFAGWPSNQLSPDGVHYLGGVRTFYQPGLTIRISFTSASTSDVSDLMPGGGSPVVGTVFNTLTAGHITYSFPYNGAFLGTGVSYTETALGTGNQIEQITEEYLLSPAPGWNTDIYA
jgi:hypothetical protein